MSIANITSALSQKILQNSPAILTGISVAGVVATAVLTGKAAIKAHDDILAEETRRYEEENNGIPLTAKEKVQLTWLHFLPPLFVGSVTIVCAISAQSLNTRRNAALMSLYTLSDRALTEFKNKTEELHGEGKVDKIYEGIAKDRIEARDPADDFDFVNDSRSYDERLVYCYDVWTDRYFWSNRNDVDAAVNEINAEINRNNYASLNAFYDQIGLPGIQMGDDFGWNVDHKLEVSYTYGPARDGSPCMAVHFKRSPQQDYYSFR